MELHKGHLTEKVFRAAGAGYEPPVRTINACSGMVLSEENLTALVYSVGVLRGECREKRPMEQALASLERFQEVRSAYLTGMQRPSGYIKNA